MMRLQDTRRAFVVASGAALAAGFIRPARAAQFAWKCGDSIGSTHPLNVRLTEAFGKIRDETKGEIDIKLFPSGALGANSSMTSQLRLGAMEMMADTGDDFDSIVPIGSIDNVPFAYPNAETAHRAFDGGLGSLVRYAFYSKGLFTFDRVYDSGFRQITTSTKPIRNVDDLRGLKLRVAPSRFRLDLFRSLGASATPIDYAQLYSALQTHVVDGEENPLSGIEDQKFYEVQKYCSLSNHMWAAFWIFVNKDKWDSLSRPFQAIMRKHVNAGAMAQRTDFVALEKSVRERLTSRGLAFNDVDVDSFRKKLKETGFYGRWRDTWGSTVWTELEKYSGPLA